LKDAIDLYGRLLIAIFSFVAPAMTLLIGLFGGGLSRYRKRNEEISKQLENLILIKPNDVQGVDNKQKIEGLKASISLLEKQKKVADKDERLLSGKRQVIRIFIPLILSTLFLTNYYVLRSSYLQMVETFWYKLITLSLSLTCLVFTLLVVRQVFNKIIEVKELIENEAVLEAEGNNEIQAEQEL
jgi:hypothetical protein